MPWAVGRANSEYSVVISDQCNSSGEEAYCPMVVNRTRLSHLKKYVEKAVPAYPGYFFVKEEFVESVKALHRTRVSFMVAKSKFVLIDDVEIERIKQMEAIWNAKAKEPIRKTLSIGDKVSIETKLFGFSSGMVVGVYKYFADIETKGRIIKINTFLLEKIGV